MGVYRPKRRGQETPYFHFDFTIGGERFHGSTGQTSKRNAEAFERRKRQEVADGAIKARKHELLTLDQAAGLYWEHIGSARRSKNTIKREIEVILELIGKRKRIGEIRTPEVQALVTGRREGKAARTEPNPSPATINRTLETLRAVLRYIEEVYEAPLPKIAWRRMMLAEPKPPERTFSPHELQAWADELKPIERFFLIALATYGPRFGELFMPPESIDVSNPERPVMLLGRYKGRELREVRKDGTLLEVVLLPEDARIFAALADRARSIGAEVIWVEETSTGRLAPVNYYAMRNRLRDAAERAGVKSGRLIHSLRHHAATALVGESNDIVLARQLLGHSSITTTQRYAHASDAKLMGALSAISRTGPERPSIESLKPVNNQALGMVPPPGLEPRTQQEPDGK